MESDISRKSAFCVLFCITLITLLLVTVFLPPRAILTNTPIYSDDYAMHYAQCRAVKKYISMFLSCWAYDPFYLAGMPNGTLGNADNKAWEVFYFLFSGVLGEGFAFKAYVVLFFLAYPVLLYAAARNFGLSRKIGLIAAGMGLLFFHLSLCISMVAWGMISYVFVCFFSIYVLSLWWRMLESFSITRCILFAVCLSIMVMMHILAVVHMGIPMAVMYLYRARHLPVRHQGMLIGSVIGGLAINSFWLWPVVDFFNDQTTRPENYEFTLQIKNVFEPLKVYIQQRRSTDHCMPVLNNTFFETLLLLFGVAGLYLWRKENRKALWHAFTAGICTIFLIAYYGSHTTLFPPLQPERYTIPLSLLLLVPASVAVARVLQAFVHRASLPTKFFIGALTFVLLYQPVVRPFGIFYKYKPYRLHTEMPEPITRLLDFLKYNTDREGRILIEDSEYTRARPDHQYFGGHYPAIFPEYVQREYLSGPRPLYPVKHSYASFTNGVLFERDITAYTDQELEEAFNLFNVRWIVAWNQKSKDVFSQNPRSISKLCDIDKFSVYTVNRQPSFFIKGSGKLRAEYNRIELTDVHPEDGEVIISYHWMKKLRAIPETTLEPVSLGGDPIGFIKIKNPPRAFVIVNTY